MTGEPGELYELHLERAEIELLAEPVLIIALDGYIDAGSGVQAGGRPPAVDAWSTPWSAPSTSTS